MNEYSNRHDILITKTTQKVSIYSESDQAEDRRRQFHQQRQQHQEKISPSKTWRSSMVQWQNVASLFPGVAYTLGFLQKLG
jgi:hypothetical protein